MRISARYVVVLAAFVVRAPAAFADGGCTTLDAWLDLAVAGWPVGVPVRIDSTALPAGPEPGAGIVLGGVMPGDERSIEFAVIESDTAASDARSVRSVWLTWVERCVAERGEHWVESEIDLEMEQELPASKAMGQFPLQAYIREDDVPAGMRFDHAESGASLEVITDPTEIASRSVTVGYEGPPVVLLLRIRPGPGQ